MTPLDEMNRHVAAAADLLKALAHPERLRVLCQLVEGEKGVGELLANSQLGQSAFSQQLSVLKRCGLIRSRKVSQQIFYSLVSEAAVDVLAALQTHFCHSDEETR
ncbi:MULTISPECIES: ArsR/SmtB family transcription factor [Aeromonas]|jgi:DNA-binding transcriptional ArsR family regulator|uniref:Transcriptional regulator n=1 Tax=Aeromonas caviae TaxID=648 RepID=A0A3G9IPD2_AERCA|nr:MULTISPECIES: metalloregulator ArsR/SmtB family transcription factor [Aeromonas]MBP4060681.1 helix-turn-helix transcriptional regulator [Aeromonas sp. Prich7-2]MDH0318469.1 metalloregulator ArsR/SmtB family transcription factor [Aeromonas caviae]MDH0351998.1 metalloregulator ArsR/SmtB family transcription factor [Aeromonas caviae]MDH1450259.1 metalloregulator ArsR/SmtB family transcription factor [Aeromonas caviae]MDH1454153.1 metalloregulator ArsR/SmtB family transcription factor [Aeromona